MDILDKIKINPFFRTIRFFPEMIVERIINKIKEKDRIQRENGKVDPLFCNLKMLENSHANQRCFIVATGPSLKIEDLELIKNEITFSMNSIIKLFENTKWRPTYYGIQDRFVYDKLKSEIKRNSNEFKKIFIPDYLAKYKEYLSDNTILFPYNYEYHNFETIYHKYFTKFSGNAYGMVYDGYSITYSLIQLAIYMGFKEIYLLGCDCSYKKGQINHVVESGHVDKYEFLNYQKMIVGYNKVKEFCDKNNIKVYNCTRGGMLEVFERIELETIVKGIKK